MAKFKYVANFSGKEEKGIVEAADIDSAKYKLKDKGGVVLSIKESKSLSDASWNVTIGTPVKKKDLTIFCKQFHSILAAGVTIIDGLRMVQDQTSNKYLREALYNVQTSVEKGDSLAGAMRAEKNIFPPILIHMVEAGEATGNLEVAFERICTQFEKDMKLNSMLKSAMIYPIVVLVVTVGVVIILMTTVIPNFQSTFEDMGEELPMLTQVVVAVSDFMVANIIPIIAVIVGLVIFFLFAKTTEPFKMLVSKIAVKIPMFKDFTIKNAAAKFSMTMATLIMSGVSIVDALDISANVIENRIIRKTLKDCREQVMQGIPLSDPLEESGIFPPMVYHMLRIGEETGTTEQMLDKVAEFYEQEVEVATKNLTTAMEPAIIVVLAGVVGVIMGAVMMPMLSIYQNAGNA